MKDIRSYKFNASFINIKHLAPYAYDGMWALALALNTTNAVLMKSSLSLENFSYDNTYMSSLLLEAMDRVEFHGLTVGME